MAARIDRALALLVILVHLAGPGGVGLTAMNLSSAAAAAGPRPGENPARLARGERAMEDPQGPTGGPSTPAPRQRSADEIEDQLANPPRFAARDLMAVPVQAEEHMCDPDAKSGSASPAHRDLYVSEAPSIDLDVAFDFGKASLTPEGRAQLDQLAAALLRPALLDQHFALAGHTDAKGEAGFNQRLSCARARAVRTYLSERHGIAAERMVPLGFGATLLKNPSAPLDGINRRVEIRLQPK